MEPRTRKQILVVILILFLSIPPLLNARADDPWEDLKGFTLVPNSPARVEEHYVAALFQNSEKGLLAVVLFNVTCDSDRCKVNNRAAYSLFNDEGRNVRVYVDPQEPELLKLISNQVVV
jgi:hypothetical protein